MTPDINTTACCTLQSVVISPVDNIIVGAGLLLFFIGLIIFRYKAILSPSMMRLETKVQTLRAHISAYPEAIMTSAPVMQQKHILDTLEQKTLRLTWCDKCYISSGKVTAGWRMLHNAKNIIVDDIDDIHEELELARIRLLELERNDAKLLAKQIELKLKETPLRPETLRQLLAEGLRIYHEQRDDYFEMLADWQNKTMWLTYITILFIGVLVWAENNALLLVAGGIGGLLSKLRSVIQKPDTPNDYGFSWSTLFLTPLVGMLTGWAGVYMVLVMMKVEIFGDIFTKALTDGQACTLPALMMIAVVFGYSAGLFEKMITRIESYAIKEKQKLEKNGEKKDTDTPE